MTPTTGPTPPSPLLRCLLWVQGVYFFLTGVWPLIELDSFELITGPKVDDWLVQTVGALITVVAIVLLMAAWRRRLAAEVVVLAIGSALALTAVDVVFVARDRISSIYLVDAAAELVLLAVWAYGLARWRLAEYGDDASASQASRPAPAYQPTHSDPRLQM